MGSVSERLLLPKFDIISARGVYRDKEIIIREELEACLVDLNVTRSE